MICDLVEKLEFYKAGSTQCRISLTLQSVFSMFVPSLLLNRISVLSGGLAQLYEIKPDRIHLKERLNHE